MTLEKSENAAAPTICLHGENDGASLAGSSEGMEKYFADFYERKVLDGIGHFISREQPEAFTEAVLRLA